MFDRFLETDLGPFSVEKGFVCSLYVSMHQIQMRLGLGSLEYNLFNIILCWSEVKVSFNFLVCPKFNYVYWWHMCQKHWGILISLLIHF